MRALAIACPTRQQPDGEIRVLPGPQLLRDVEHGPSLRAHRECWGDLRVRSADQLLELLQGVDIRGRGGAGFPFARKLSTAMAARGRPAVVVNASEGEPASFKDAALVLTRPHLVLDGAVATARALRTKTIHVVVPSDRPAVERRLQRAITERARRDGAVRWAVHRAEPRFVAGQARAVIELMSGRENLPVTAWQPEAVDGYRGRPTLLSNAETFAHVGLLALEGSERYRDFGTPEEPGTVLLTVTLPDGLPHVVEVAHGTPWPAVLHTELLERPVLVGGYHGTWAAPGDLAGLRVSRSEMSARGLALGAGVVLPLAPGQCPVHRAATIARYLARQSAGRCGPCFNGLPALAETMRDIDDGRHSAERLHSLAEAVTRRGACAHPDGTARMVSSVLSAYAGEVEAHADGWCSFTGEPTAAGRTSVLAMASGDDARTRVIGVFDEG